MHGKQRENETGAERDLCACFLFKMVVLLVDRPIGCELAPRTLGGRLSLALAAENGQLVAEESVLYDQIHSAARSVVGDRGRRGLIVRRCPVPQQAKQRLTENS